MNMRTILFIATCLAWTCAIAAEPRWVRVSECHVSANGYQWKPYWALVIDTKPGDAKPEDFITSKPTPANELKPVNGKRWVRIWEGKKFASQWHWELWSDRKLRRAGPDIETDTDVLFDDYWPPQAMGQPDVFDNWRNGGASTSIIKPGQ